MRTVSAGHKARSLFHYSLFIPHPVAAGDKKERIATGGGAALAMTAYSVIAREPRSGDRGNPYPRRRKAATRSLCERRRDVGIPPYAHKNTEPQRNAAAPPYSLKAKSYLISPEMIFVICARVSTLSGAKVVAVMPLMMPAFTSARTSGSAQSVKGLAAGCAVRPFAFAAI